MFSAKLRNFAQSCVDCFRKSYAALSKVFDHLGRPRSVDGKNLVLDRYDHFTAAGIALSCAAPKQLAVNAPRFMIFGKDDMEAAAFGNPGTEPNVSSASGHIGRDGYPGRQTRHRYDVCLFLILFRVKKGMRNALRG